MLQWIHSLISSNMFCWELLIFSHNVFIIVFVMNMMPQSLDRPERLYNYIVNSLSLLPLCVQMCGSLKLSLERVLGNHLMARSIVYNILLLVEDVDGEEDTDTGPTAGWEVLKDPEGELAVGSQIGVKVCYFIAVYVIILLL